MLVVYLRLHKLQAVFKLKKMKTEQKILTMLKDHKKLVGCRQVLRGLSEGTVRCVVVSEDADGKIKSHLVKTAMENNVKVLHAPSMEWLGRNAGIDVGAATVGFLKSKE